MKFSDKHKKILYLLSLHGAGSVAEISEAFFSMKGRTGKIRGVLKTLERNNYISMSIQDKKLIYALDKKGITRIEYEYSLLRQV